MNEGGELLVWRRCAHAMAVAAPGQPAEVVTEQVCDQVPDHPRCRRGRALPVLWRQLAQQPQELDPVLLHELPRVDPRSEARRVHARNQTDCHALPQAAELSRRRAHRFAARVSRPHALDQADRTRSLQRATPRGVTAHLHRRRRYRRRLSEPGAPLGRQAGRRGAAGPGRAPAGGHRRSRIRGPAAAAPAAPAASRLRCARCRPRVQRTAPVTR